MATDVLLSPEQVAQRLGVSLPTAYRLFQARRFPVVFVGRLRRVRESDLSAWMDSETRRQPDVEVAGSGRTKERRGA